ncbi:hypothetical protein [Lacinutrix chionoecetis]
MRRKTKIYLLFFLISCFGFSQNTSLKGSVEGEESVENIHVINRTQDLFATTNDRGEFTINAKTNDTIVFTSVQYKAYTHIVSAENITNKTLKIKLEVLVNELPEAVVGFTLTGDLTKDILNTDVERPIDFYDVGIPGYTGKPKTKSERLLYDADHGKMFAFYGIAGAVNVNKLLNAISGRTKKLKKRVALEANTKLMNALKNRLSEAFFKENPLDQALRADFFYFCAEDKNFTKRCQTSDLEALKFMQEKYILYKENLAEKE